MPFVAWSSARKVFATLLARPADGGKLAILVTVATVWLTGLEAADRVTVIVPPAAQETAEQLVGSVAETCNRGDFVGFMSHFTPSHARRIRGPMEDIFVRHRPRMDVRRVTLLSDSPQKITFGVQYAWHDRDKPEQVVASKVTARMVDGEWKLDGEVVKSSTPTISESSVAEAGGLAPAAWNPFAPPADLINPAVEHLRGDVGIQPGRGCADGRCGR